MATGPGPQQRFPSHIVRISFPKPGGLVYFFWRYNYAIIKDPSSGAPPTARVGTASAQLPAPYDVTFDFSDSELDLENFHMFADAPYTLLGKDLPANILSANPPITVVNPVTLNMLKKYAIFSPATGIYDLSLTTPVAGFDVYVVDRAQWTMTYNHHVTFSLSPVMTKEEAINQFKSLAGTTGYEGITDTSLIGVDLTDIFGNSLLVPSPLFFSMAAGGGWEYHTEPSGGSNAYGRESGTGMIFNLGLLKSFVKQSERGTKEYNFKMTFAKKNEMQAVELFAETFETGQRLNFPVDAKKRPTWDTWFPPESFTIHPFTDVNGFVKLGSVASNQTANVKITLATTNVQGQRVPPFTEISLSGSGGGEG